METSRWKERGMDVAFSTDEESVLEILERNLGSKASVLLQDGPDQPNPVLRLLHANSADSTRRYHILGELARGGVGIIFKARDRDLGRDVAIKVLKKEYASRPEILDRFIEEAQIGGQLQHPGIVPIYGIGMQKDGRPFFAMKLVKGRTLTAILRSGDPQKHRRRYLSLFERICQTVAYAHARGVIHRDLKSANIMVGAFGEVQVMDWGFAKVLGTERRVHPPMPMATIVATVRSGSVGSASIAGSVMGTPAYMPPEQALGRVNELDERCDVFALGAILCEILTGLPPYAGENRDLLLMAAQAHLEDAHQRLDECGADGALIERVKVYLAPLPENRPEDAQRVMHDIHAFLAQSEQGTRAQEIAAAEARVTEEEEKTRLARETLHAKQKEAAALEAEHRAKAEKLHVRKERAAAKAA